MATALEASNGAITSVDEAMPPGSEFAIAERDHLTTQSDLLNSVLSHKSARCALECALVGTLSDLRGAGLQPATQSILAEHNSGALNAPDKSAYCSVGQDDYDTWTGEASLAQWGTDAGFGNEG